MTTLADYESMARRASMAKFIIGVLLVLGLCLFIGGKVFGGGHCAVQLRHHHAVALQPVIALNQVYPPSYYSVGAAIQEEAIAERVASLVLSKLAEMPAEPAEPGAPEPIPGEHAQLNQSAVNASCVKCHGGDKPKAGIDLSNLADLDCETRLAAIRAVLNQTMPKGAQLDPAEVGDVLTELAGEDPASTEGE